MAAVVLALWTVQVWTAAQERLLAPLPGSDCQILLVDMYRFGLTRDHAYREWDRAYSHKRHMEPEVMSWNSRDTYHQWEAETAWRLKCWRLLIDAMDPNFGRYGWNVFAFATVPQSRLHLLYRLREEIGDENFWEGRMPKPTPTYRR